MNERFDMQSYMSPADMASPTAKETPLESNLARLISRTNTVRVLTDLLSKRLELVSSRMQEKDSEVAPAEPHLGSSPLVAGLTEVFSQLGTIEYRLQRLIKSLEI